MNCDERLEKLLNRAGQTISDLPRKQGESVSEPYSDTRSRQAAEGWVERMSDSNRVRMIEPVVNGLEHCLHDTDPGQPIKCQGCPYRANEETDWSYCCSHALRDDAAELLEPMRAKPLTLDEAIRLLNIPRWAEWWECTTEGCDIRQAGWVIVKDLFVSDPLFVTFTHCFGDKRFLEERYNRGWRMWSAEPTEAQREAWEWERN